MIPAHFPFARKKWFVFGAFLALVCALLVPVLSVDHTQTIDLVNHMARQFVRTQIAAGGVLSKMYTFQWIVVPDLAIDLFVAPLQRFFSTYDCGRLLVGAIIILWPLLAGMVVYNGNLTWGFAAYLLSAACAVLAFAGWVATENKPAAARIAGFALLAFLLYCGHLIAFGIFGILVGGFEISRLYFAGKLTLPSFLRRGFALSPMFVPEVLHFLYLNITFPPTHGTDTIAVSTSDRFLTLISPFVDGMSTVGDTTQTQAALLNFFFLAFVVGFLAVRNTLGINRNMILSLVVLLIVAVATPPKLLGVSLTHLRLPFVVVALFIASLEPREKKDNFYAVMAGCFVALLATRVAFITDSWKTYDAQSKEFIAKTAFIRAGDKVLVVNNRYPLSYVEHYHTASLLVIENQAFIPNLFTAAHIFHPKGDYRRLAPPTATHPMDARLLQMALDRKSPRLDEPAFSYWKKWWKDYDYVIAYQPPGQKGFYAKQLRPASEGSFFTVYKVKK